MDSREKPAAHVFTHHARSGEPFAFDPSRTYAQDRPWTKPKGLWLSVDGDWERWCSDGEMGWTVESPQRFDVDLDRLLVIRHADMLDAFHQEYVVRQVPDLGDRPNFYRVNWEPLSRAFAGIMIAPYLWERRLDGEASEWYYPWDCASACVWDLTAVSVMENADV